MSHVLLFLYLDLLLSLLVALLNRSPDDNPNHCIGCATKNVVSSLVLSCCPPCPGQPTVEGGIFLRCGQTDVVTDLVCGQRRVPSLSLISAWLPCWWCVPSRIFSKYADMSTFRRIPVFSKWSKPLHHTTKQKYVSIWIHMDIQTRGDQSSYELCLD